MNQPVPHNHVAIVVTGLRATALRAVTIRIDR